MQDEQKNPRESIWSIRPPSLIRYYVAFGLLFVLITGLYLWRGFATALPGTHTVDVVLASLKEASGLTPWLIIFTYYLVEGLSVLAERYLKIRYEEGRVEGLEVGREEGREKGLEDGWEKGREEERLQWTAWNRRREEALSRGKEFTEPPPGYDGENAS